MGVYVNVRGWLECDDRQLDQIRQIVQHDAGPYRDGWAFPARQINWINHAFHGASIRAGALDRFLGQLHRMAALPASDEDGDRVTGLFLVSHEEGGRFEWQVRDGDVHISPAHDRYEYLDG